MSGQQTIIHPTDSAINIICIHSQLILPWSIEPTQYKPLYNGKL